MQGSCADVNSPMSPPINKSAELTQGQGALQLIHYSEVCRIMTRHWLNSRQGTQAQYVGLCSCIFLYVILSRCL
jgi:hypothetical protein